MEDETEENTGAQDTAGDTVGITVNTGTTEPPNTAVDEQQMETDSDNFNLAEVGRQAKTLQDKANHRTQTEADQESENDLAESETDRDLERHLQQMRQQAESAESATDTFQQMEERVQEATNNKPTTEPPSLQFDIAHASTDQAMPTDPS